MTGPGLRAGEQQSASFCSAPQAAHSRAYGWTDTGPSALSFDPHNKPVVMIPTLYREAQSLGWAVGFLQTHRQLVRAELGLDPRLVVLWPNILFPDGLPLSQNNPEWPEPLTPALEDTGAQVQGRPEDGRGAKGQASSFRLNSHESRVG